MIDQFQRWAAASCIVAAGVWAAGCEKPAEVTPPVVPAEHDDHDHVDGDHHTDPPAPDATTPATPPADPAAASAGGSTLQFDEL